MDEPISFKVNIIYGHCESNSWFKFEEDKIVGMGSVKTFDSNGKLIDYKESPTGINLIKLHQIPPT